MANRSLVSIVLALVFFFEFSSTSTSIFASAKAPARRPISDEEIRRKKGESYADIESGLRGSDCKSSLIMKENCALRCLSPACYELVYVGDPLEEGEIDFVRSQEYKYCMHKLSIGESLDGVKGSFHYN